MSYRSYGMTIAVGLTVACTTSAREARTQNATGDEVTIEQAAPRRLAQKSPLNDVLKCEPFGLSVTRAPENPGPDEPKRLLRSDSVTVSLRCTNLGAKAIRGARGVLSLEGVFGEPLLTGSFEQVWSRTGPLAPNGVVEFAPAAMRASVSLDSPAGRFLRAAELDEFGPRHVEITHLAFADGSVARHDDDGRHVPSGVHVTP